MPRIRCASACRWMRSVDIADTKGPALAERAARRHALRHRRVHRRLAECRRACAGDDCGQSRQRRRTSSASPVAECEARAAARHDGAATAHPRTATRAFADSARADASSDSTTSRLGAAMRPARPRPRRRGHRRRYRRRARRRHHRAVAGDVHDRARHVDRQRVDPRDLRRHGRQLEPGHVGHHVVRRRQRDRRAAHRMAHAAFRPGPACSRWRRCCSCSRRGCAAWRRTSSR